MKLFKKIIFLVAFLAIAGLVAVIYMYNKPQKNIQHQKADFVLTASSLLKEFISDESGASQKFTGRIIEVTGRIAAKDIENGNVVSITLEADDEASSVICTFHDRIAPVEIDTMKNVIVRGELSGYLMDVLLNNCVLVK